MFRFLKKYGQNGHYYKLIHRIFGVWASNIELYKLALVHRSASVIIEDGSAINNERLEFLGDAVLELLVSEMLFVGYQQMQEGELTQLRSKIVCRNSLNALGRKLGLKYEIIANTASNTFSKHNMYGDAVEALCGALYLDQGYDKASKSLLNLFDNHINVEEILATEMDFKSRVLEWAQRNRMKMEFWSERSANYSESNPMFECVLMINDKKYGYGCSRSKKEAEQKASRQALDMIDSEEE